MTSEGSNSKLMLRPTVWNWSRMNQSPVATVCPSTMTLVRLGEVPRMLTRSFSSKPPSPLACDWVFTPGRRCNASAMFLSGSLPISMAEIASTWLVASFLTSIAFCNDWRMPVTTTSPTAVLLASAAMAGAVAHSRATPLAEPTRIFLRNVIGLSPRRAVILDPFI